MVGRSAPIGPERVRVVRHHVYIDMSSRSVVSIDVETQETETLLSTTAITSDLFADPLAFVAEQLGENQEEAEEPAADGSRLSLADRADQTYPVLRALGSTTTDEVATHLPTNVQNAYRWLAELERQGRATRTRDGRRDTWSLV